jgi:hypothetical protein
MNKDSTAVENSEVMTTEVLIEAARAEEPFEFKSIAVDQLIPNSKNLFPELDDARHEAFAENIRKNGIREAIIVRPLSDSEEEKFEIIAGHKRFRVAQDLGLPHIKSEVRRGLSDDEAMDILIGSNVDRQSFIELPYSVQAQILIERNRILKKKKSDVKKAKKSTEKADNMVENSIGCQNDNGERISKILEDEYALDDRKIGRLIRMGEHLDKNLFNKVDGGILPCGAGHDLSFLNKKEQDQTNIIIDKLISENKHFKMSGKQAEILKSKHGKLSLDKISTILQGRGKEENPKRTVTLKAAFIEEYFKKDDTTDDIQFELGDALELKRNILPELMKKYLSGEKPSEFDIEDFVTELKKYVDVSNP